jgi:hypothetical protein
MCAALPTPDLDSLEDFSDRLIEDQFGEDFTTAIPEPFAQYLRLADSALSESVRQP